jgi:hypothetical protein
MVTKILDLAVGDYVEGFAANSAVVVQLMYNHHLAEELGFQDTKFRITTQQ